MLLVLLRVRKSGVEKEILSMQSIEIKSIFKCCEEKNYVGFGNRGRFLRSGPKCVRFVAGR